MATSPRPKIRAEPSARPIAAARITVSNRHANRQRVTVRRQANPSPAEAPADIHDLTVVQIPTRWPEAGTSSQGDASASSSASCTRSSAAPVPASWR
jgi:hypothetical protein